MQTDLETIRTKIIETAEDSHVASYFRGVDVESDWDFTGDDFLRLIIHLGPKLPPLPELARLRDAIEAAVSVIDDRFPSVRFADPG